MTKADKLDELGYTNIYDGLVWIKEDKDYVCSITLACEGYFKNMFSIYIKQENVYLFTEVLQKLNIITSNDNLLKAIFKNKSYCGITWEYNKENNLICGKIDDISKVTSFKNNLKSIIN